MAPFTTILACCDNTKQTDSISNTTEVSTEEQLITKPAKQDDFKFETYCNGRFGFCIDYPTSKLYPQGESGNGDGQVFKSKDAETTLWVYRDFRDNVDPEFVIATGFNLDSWGNNPDSPKRVITYKKLGNTYYVVSGYNEGKIFYQKTVITVEGLVTSIIEYPESEKEYYNKVSETIFESLK